jgi:hypothetical protein
LDSSRAGFDSTKSGSDFDELSKDEGNCRSHKCQGRLVLRKRRFADETTFIVFEARCFDIEARQLGFEK